MKSRWSIKVCHVMKIIAQNKKALFDYEVLERIEAGIALSGDEVKSLRKGGGNLVGAFAVARGRTIWLLNAYIAPYSHAFQKMSEQEARKSRQLLLKRREINKLIGGISQKGYTLVPIKLYLNERGYVKVDLGVCKHKKAYKKKEELRERDIQRETQRELRGRSDY
ncbi:MAG: SsrA-binding protein [Lentisphaerae bacterium GWF2_44_16]|nr:MAG: SsrA-binding protein [Lentisphaerae bacterium GWF2_44_16]